MKNFIKIAEYISSTTKWDDVVNSENIEYAFIGRSNVGKSSLINYLTNNNKLALISSSPGKTRTINSFLINKSWNLVDLPGYGYAKISKEQRQKWAKFINKYLENRKNLVNTFVLIDSNIPPQKIDLNFINKLGEKGIPFSLIFTKIDKLSITKVDINIQNFKNKMLEVWEELPPIFKVSSLKKKGKDKILSYIFEINKTIQGF